MATISFDIAAFRAAFPEFSNETTYPDVTLQMYFDMATCYISDLDAGCLTGSCRTLALNLMTAHLTRIGTQAQAGGNSGFVTSSSIDKISVSVNPPPNANQYSWWLSNTPYGQQLQALLSSNIVGGLYVSGRPEKSAFRKVGGFF